MTDFYSFKVNIQNSNAFEEICCNHMKTSNRKKQLNNSRTVHYTASEIITIQSSAEKIASIDQRCETIWYIKYV